MIPASNPVSTQNGRNSDSETILIWHMSRKAWSRHVLIVLCGGPWVLQMIDLSYRHVTSATEIEISGPVFPSNFIFTNFLALVYLIESIVPEIPFPSIPHSSMNQKYTQHGITGQTSVTDRHFRSFTSRWFVHSWLVVVKFVPREILNYRWIHVFVTARCTHVSVQSLHDGVHITTAVGWARVSHGGRLPGKRLINHSLKRLIWTRLLVFYSEA